jgi:cell division protein FtsW
MSIDCDVLKKNAKNIILVTIGLLVCAIIPGIGHTAGGASRWISFIFFNVQPSELAKLSVLIYLAYFIDKNESHMINFLRGYLPVLIICGTIMGLVLLEPDLGTTVTIGFMMFLMLFIGGANLKHIATTILSTVPFVYYLIFSVPYRRKRIMAFINPWLDERDTGFQIVQSYIALGSGGLLGVGLGQSKQKLFFLPASHTDFILSIIGEELGFIGVTALLILFFIFIWQGTRAAFKVNDTFRKMLIFGIVFMIAFEVIVNVGVSVGLFPTKGLPLPFVSYGGTSLIVHMVAIGLLLNATRD